MKKFFKHSWAVVAAIAAVTVERPNDALGEEAGMFIGLEREAQVRRGFR